VKELTKEEAARVAKALDNIDLDAEAALGLLSWLKGEGFSPNGSRSVLCAALRLLVPASDWNDVRELDRR